MGTELKYGLITGVAVCLYVLIEFSLGFHTTRMEIGEYSGYFATIIPLITLYLGIKKKRDKDQHGQISFGKGVLTGLLISVVSALITTSFFLLYYRYINPEFLDLGIAFETNRMTAAGKTMEDVTVRVEQLKTMSSEPFVIVFGLLGTTGMGLFLSLLLSAFLKKKHGVFTT